MDPTVGRGGLEAGQVCANAVHRGRYAGHRAVELPKKRIGVGDALQQHREHIMFDRRSG